jgi:L-asparaginase II
MLARLGLDESALRCGTHPPGDRAAREMLRLTGAEPAPAQHNCSGKHSGMLAVAQLRGAPLETYLHPDHPVQQHIRRALGEMAGLAPEAIGVAVDGCSAPTFAIPLRATALAFARLMDPDGLPASRALACRRIVAAMQAHPVMVSGDGELDTAVLRALAGRLIIKGGAEGYCGIGLAPGASGPGSPALGVAFKIIDGNGPRARGPVTIEILRQLGVCPDVPPALAEFHHTPVKNYRGTVTGEVRPVVQLTRLAG